MSDITFEQAMSKIQSILSQLEKGEIPLMEATKLFEEGLELLKFCEKQLSSFEEKVDTLKLEKMEKSDESQ